MLQPGSVISYSASSANGSRAKGAIYKTVSRESRVDEMLFGAANKNKSGSGAAVVDRNVSAPTGKPTMKKSQKPEHIQIITKDLIRKLMSVQSIVFVDSIG